MASRIPPLLSEQFGPLQGVRILSTGTLIAAPFAAALAAEMGAEVVHVERPGEGDTWRTLVATLKTKTGDDVNAAWIQERRNCFHTTLDFGLPEGRDLFLDMIPHFDIWMESSKPGTYDRWGLADERVLRANPGLVIAHVSGYGQDGHPDYLGRASYDLVAQAFGGSMFLTGFPDPDPPVKSSPLTADYLTASFCLWSVLAGYIYSQKTGKGQVIDLAQYEAVHQILSGTMIRYFEEGVIGERNGNRGRLVQPFDAFQAKDGLVVILAFNAVFDRVCQVLGLDPTEEHWNQARFEDSPEGIEFDAILRGWVEERTVAEVVEVMNAAQVGCSPIMNAQDMAEDPHYQARQVHIEWEDEQLGRKVKGVGVTPKFSETPGKIWRGSVPVGYDNNLVYGHYLGLSEAEVGQLQEQGVI